VSRVRSACAGAAIVLANSGCHHRTASAEPAGSNERVVHGIVSVTGTAFEQRLVLQTGSGPLRLHAAARDSAALVHVQGTDVSVRGTDEPNALRVETFTVIRVGRDSALDGYIRRDGGRLVLETTNGAFELGNPPSGLRQLVGARVWVQGPLATGPNAYGVIIPPL